MITETHPGLKGRGYIITFEGHGAWSPEGKLDGRPTAEDIERHNAVLNAQELEAWAECPDQWSGYIVERDGREVFTTFMGTALGRVVRHLKARRVTPQGFRWVQHSYSIRGSNGAMYHGKHGDMSLLRVRKARG